MDIQRRRLLQVSLAAGAAYAGGLVVSRVALAAPAASGNRFVFVLLRGALDGLAAVPPVGDPDYARLRGELDLSNAPSLHRLNDTFALHPSLNFMAELWQQQQLAVIHAASTPYRERSHFDAQDVLESGYTVPHAAQSGWLNRALSGLPATQRGAARDAGVALGANVPLVMRGPTEVASWSPSRMPELDGDTLQRIGQMYGSDPLLSQRLADALAADEIADAGMGKADGMNMAAQAGRGAALQLGQTAKAAAGFLTQPDGPSVAMFDTTGWDTHANEGADKGTLAVRLGGLDQGLRALHDALGDSWNRTVVLVATEFGRTAAVNGTRGTDHGTGAAAFLLGGAVRGGRIVGDWPGLAPSALYQGRDLKPTTDLRSVMKSVLRDHLEVPQKLLETQVFPDSGAAGYLPDLVRA